MKKILLILVLMICLCGCEDKGPEYLISGMGFDKAGQNYNVCFESVIINSEDTKQTVKLLKGEGETLKQAVDEIYKQATQPLLLSHCGVLVMGENITENQIKEIGDYCLKGDKITLSAFLIKTENAQNLLSVKPVSSVAVGFDIMGLIEQNKIVKNRLFEVISLGYKNKLPTVCVKNGGLKLETR